MFLFVIAVVVMGHRRKRSEAAKAYISTNSCTELSKTQFFPVPIVKEKLIISSFLIGIDSLKLTNYKKIKNLAYSKHY